MQTRNSSLKYMSYMKKNKCYTRLLHLPQYYYLELQSYIRSYVLIHSCTYYQILYQGTCQLPSTFVQDLVIRKTMYYNTRQVVQLCIRTCELDQLFRNQPRLSGMDQHGGISNKLMIYFTKFPHTNYVGKTILKCVDTLKMYR